MAEGAPPPADARWLNLLISALVALYLSYSWSVDAPLEASEAQKQSWFLADHIYKWSLAAAAAVLAGGTIALLMRRRSGLLLGAAGEAWFALTLAVMLVDLLVEPPFQLDLTFIIVLIVLLLSASQARELWRAYRHTVPLPDRRAGV